MQKTHICVICDLFKNLLKTLYPMINSFFFLLWFLAKENFFTGQFVLCKMLSVLVTLSALSILVTSIFNWTLAGTILWIRVRPSFRPSGSFLQIGLLVFFKHSLVLWGCPWQPFFFFFGKPPSGINDEKWSKMVFRHFKKIKSNSVK